MTRRITIDRDELLNAAEQVIADGGVSRLTLEAVAARAGVSKGGLQYVFKSKTALIEAMIQRFIDRAEADFELELERLGGDPKRSLEAYVRSNLTGEFTSVHTALMAAIASEPELLEPIDTRFAETIDRLVRDTGLPRARVTAVMLASDGLMLMAVMGVRPVSAKERTALLRELVRLATP